VIAEREEPRVGELLADMLANDGVEILLALEKEFHCKIPDEVALKLHTYGDIVDYIEHVVAHAEEPAIVDAGAAPSA